MTQLWRLAAILAATALLSVGSSPSRPASAANEADSAALSDRLKQLTDRLHSPVEEQRRSAAVLLGQFGRLAQPALADLTKRANRDRSAPVRQAAADAVARIKRGDPPTAAALASLPPAKTEPAAKTEPSAKTEPAAKPDPETVPAEPNPDLLGVCFVLDCSSAEPALAAGRKAELLRAVEGLPNKQIFTVLLAAEGNVKPLPGIGEGLSQATTSQKARVAEAVAGVEPTNRTQENLAAALAAAAKCQPEMVCLITAAPLDAEVVEALLAANRDRVRFSVIAVGSGKRFPGKGLHKLVEGSDGKLLIVEPVAGAAPAIAAPVPTVKPRVKCLGCNSEVEPGEGYCFSCELAGKRDRPSKPTPMP